MAQVHYQKGDIFDSKAHVIVNTVNCKGVMGKGLALAFKQKYPAMFPVYQQECKIGKLRIGRPTLYQESTPWILNFPTKNDWKLPSKLEYLEKGLEYFLANYKKAGIKSIAFPKLGVQNGKLSWDEVGLLMAKYLSQLDIDVYIYIAEGDKEYQYDVQQEISLNGNFWKQFSELALSQDQLVQEVQLRPQEAKKIADRRKLMEFTSITDILNIKGVGPGSLRRIKEYIARQECSQIELFDIQDSDSSHVQDREELSKPPKGARKKRNTKAQPVAKEIPVQAQLVSQTS